MSILLVVLLSIDIYDIVIFGINIGESIFFINHYHNNYSFTNIIIIHELNITKIITLLLM